MDTKLAGQRQQRVKKVDIFTEVYQNAQILYSLVCLSC